MGLRDRGYVLDFSIPLFSGVEAARRSRFRLLFPSAMYDPYIDNGGTGSAGGLGGGDGGFSTPTDATIHTPAIMFPSLEANTLCSTDTMTSTAFASDNAQTHVATRWWIELLSTEGDPLTTGTGIYVLDTGPDTAHLTSYILTLLALTPGASYRVFNRYKGSNGGWSDFSLPVTFFMAACGACGLHSFIESASDAFDPAALTTHSFTRSPPADVTGWTSLKCYLRAGGWDDRGTVGGNVTTITSSAPTGAVGAYTGPDVLISDDGTGALTGTVTNVAAGGCGYGLTLVWTGIPPV